MALPTRKIIDACCDLIRFDYEAIATYGEAIDEVKEPALSENLAAFRVDHERHVADMAACVRNLGGKPPEKAGLRGLVRQTLTKIAGLAGTETVLRAMKSNVAVLAKEYASRSKLDLPADVLEVIQRNHNDEQRQLAWIDQTLRNRTWEQAGVHP